MIYLIILNRFDLTIAPRKCERIAVSPESSLNYTRSVLTRAMPRYSTLKMSQMNEYQIFRIQVALVPLCFERNGTQTGERGATNKGNLPVFVYPLYPVLCIFVHLRADICSANPYIGIQVHSDHPLQGRQFPFRFPVLIRQSRSPHSAALAPLITIIIGPHQEERIDRPAFERSTG